MAAPTMCTAAATAQRLTGHHLIPSSAPALHRSTQSGRGTTDLAASSAPSRHLLAGKHHAGPESITRVLHMKRGQGSLCLLASEHMPD